MRGWDACVARVPVPLTSILEEHDYLPTPRATVRSASCLTSRLRLMPIGCPWWASGPRPSNMCRGTSPSPDSPVRKSPSIENVSGLLPRCWPHLEHLSYSFPRTPHTILPPSWPISAFQAASTHSLSQYKHHHH